MPIFDFHCDKCNTTIEKILKTNGSKNIKCPKCGTKMNRMFSTKMNFKLVYNPEKNICSWGSEGYSTTQRNRAKDGK